VVVNEICSHSTLDQCLQAFVSTTTALPNFWHPCSRGSPEYPTSVLLTPGLMLTRFSFWKGRQADLRIGLPAFFAKRLQWIKLLSVPFSSHLMFYNKSRKGYNKES
jgi:hypothetical protein